MTAKKILLSVLLTCISYAGCKNTDSDNNKYSGQNNATKTTWYKRYTGTLGGQAIVVNLQCNGKMTQGSYYVIDKGIIINLLPEGHGKSDNSDLSFTENDPIARENDSLGYSTWQLSMAGADAKGKWTSADAKKTEEIVLKEEYTPGAYPMDELVRGDSLTERKGVVHVTAASFYELLQPAKQMNTADADFLRVTLLGFLGCDFPGVENLVDYTLQEDKRYFQNFERLLADLKIDRDAHEDWEYNFDHTRHLHMLYNNNGMLVFKLEESDRTGGGVMGSHFRNRYACIDMEQKRTLQLKDIMDIDSRQLSPLLNDEARKVFKISKGVLTERLRVDSIPLTDNICITGTGITFCYFPGVIAQEDEGEICFFLPYTKLKKWLKEDFKKRMPI